MANANKFETFFQHLKEFQVSRKMIKRTAVVALTGLLLACCDSSPRATASQPVEPGGGRPKPTATLVEPNPTPVVEPTKFPSLEPVGGVSATPEFVGMPEYRELIEDILDTKGNLVAKSPLTLMIEQGAPLSKEGVNAQLDFRIFDFNGKKRATWTFLNIENGKATYYSLNSQSRLIKTEVPQEFADKKANIVPVFNLRGERKRILLSGDNTQAFGLVNEETGDLGIIAKDPNKPPDNPYNPIDMTPYQKAPGVFVVDISKIAADIPAATPEAPAETLPVFSERGKMESNDGTFVTWVADSFLDSMGVNDVKLDSEKLTKAGKYMKVIWAAELAKSESMLKEYPELTLFKDATYKSIDEIVALHDKNEALGEKGLREYDFGNDVKGKIDRIEIRAAGTDAEWEAMKAKIKNDGKKYAVGKLPHPKIEESYIYFENNSLYIYLGGKTNVYNEDFISKGDHGLTLTRKTLVTPLSLTTQGIIDARLGTSGAGKIGDTLYKITDSYNVTPVNGNTGSFQIEFKKKTETLPLTNTSKLFNINQ